MNNLEDQAAAFADENWDSYNDPFVNDYKYAWSEAYNDYIENKNGE